jgi:uncharacterized protein
LQKIRKSQDEWYGPGGSLIFFKPFNSGKQDPGFRFALSFGPMVYSKFIKKIKINWMKKYFALKLISPRSTFMQDMSEEEKSIMQKHVVYWRALMDKGMVIVYGPVLDPQGGYGLGIVEVASAEEVDILIAGDPANGLNRYEYYPMRAVVPGK